VSGRQWPYLLERDVVTAWEPLAVTRSIDGRRARYALVPRLRPLRLSAVEIDLGAGFVDRPFTLTARDPAGNEHALAGGRLVRSARASDATRIGFADTRVDRVELSIDNGDEAPLAVTRARARTPLSELYLPAPAGDYLLLAGAPELDAPQYEIARARAALLAVAAVDVHAGAGGPNPEYSAGASAAHRLAEGRLLPRLAVWAVLLLAVVVLTLLTLRATRRER